MATTKKDKEIEKQMLEIGKRIRDPKEEVF